jgi:signal transduction histidine kinase
MVASVIKGEDVDLRDVMAILDEATAVIEYSRQLEQKSRALEAASAELREVNRRLEELDHLKDEFLTTVTHELRTPLTSIRSFSEILHDNPDLDARQRREFLAIVIKESERLTRLINQVLDLAKIEAGRFDWQIGAVDMKALVEEAVAATGQLFEARRVKLKLELAKGVPPARADRDQIVQVVINLLSNAVKFSPERRGRVRLALARRRDGVEVAVTDNGPGIAPENLGDVFDKFRQFADPVRGKPQGTGLGLAICRRIVEHLGGTIRVESAPGAGATFRFVVALRRRRRRGRGGEVGGSAREQRARDRCRPQPPPQLVGERHHPEAQRGLDRAAVLGRVGRARRQRVEGARRGGEAERRGVGGRGERRRGEPRGRAPRAPRPSSGGAPARRTPRAWNRTRRAAPPPAPRVSPRRAGAARPRRAARCRRGSRPRSPSGRRAARVEVVGTEGRLPEPAQRVARELVGDALRQVRRLADSSRRRPATPSTGGGRR